MHRSLIAALVSLVSLTACSSGIPEAPSGSGGGSPTATIGASSTGTGGSSTPVKAPSDLAPCAPASSFNDPLDWSHYTGASVQSELAGNAATITVSGAASDPGYSGFITSDKHQLSGCASWVHVDSVLNTVDPTAVTFFSAGRADNTHVVHMYVADDVLWMASQSGDNVTSSSVAYDAKEDAFWRIRGGTHNDVDFDVSADGASWTQLFLTPRQGWLDEGTYGFGVGAGSETTGDGMPWSASFTSFDVQQ